MLCSTSDSEYVHINKIKFWENLNKVVQKIPINENYFIGSDLNSPVIREIGSFERVHDGYG